MRVQLAPELISKVKKQDVRIRKKFKRAIGLFSKDPNNLELNNHQLKREWKGFRSINITSDKRAVFEEINEGDDPVAYFIELGTHNELYGKPKI